MPRIPSEQPASDDEADVQHKEDRSRSEADFREQRQVIPHRNAERDGGNALQGRFYAVDDVHQPILSTDAAVGQPCYPAAMIRDLVIAFLRVRRVRCLGALTRIWEAL